MIANLKEVLAAALQQTNEWFASELGRPDISLQLVTQSNVLIVTKKFVAKSTARKVDWDWEKIYHKKVKFRDAWMFAMVIRNRPGVISYGIIDIKADYVSIEYLERRPYTRGIKGLAVPVAFQFARTVAIVLELKDVRVVNPFEELVEHYIKTLGVTRHPTKGDVQYLYCRAKP